MSRKIYSRIVNCYTESMDKQAKLDIARQSTFIKETAEAWGMDPELVAELHVWASMRPDSAKAFANVMRKKYYEQYPDGMLTNVNGKIKPATGYQALQSHRRSVPA
jgi:hypothetical protein